MSEHATSPSSANAPSDPGLILIACSPGSSSLAFCRSCPADIPLNCLDVHEVVVACVPERDIGDRDAARDDSHELGNARPALCPRTVQTVDHDASRIVADAVLRALRSQCHAYLAKHQRLSDSVDAVGQQDHGARTCSGDDSIELPCLGRCSANGSSLNRAKRRTNAGGKNLRTVPGLKRAIAMPMAVSRRRSRQRADCQSAATQGGQPSPVLRRWAASWERSSGVRLR